MWRVHAGLLIGNYYETDTISLCLWRNLPHYDGGAHSRNSSPIPAMQSGEKIIKDNCDPHNWRSRHIYACMIHDSEE